MSERFEHNRATVGAVEWGNFGWRAGGTFKPQYG